MAAVWAYQDCLRPLNLLDRRAAIVKLQKEHVEEAEKKLAAKEEELKANEVEMVAKVEELVAKVEELEKARTEVAPLVGELATSREVVAEVPSLRAELQAAQDQARTTTEEMTTIKKFSRDASFDEGV